MLPTVRGGGGGEGEGGVVSALASMLYTGIKP